MGFAASPNVMTALLGTSVTSQDILDVNNEVSFGLNLVWRDLELFKYWRHKNWFLLFICYYLLKSILVNLNSLTLISKKKVFSWTCNIYLEDILLLRFPLFMNFALCIYIYIYIYIYFCMKMFNFASMSYKERYCANQNPCFTFKLSEFFR